MSVDRSAKKRTLTRKSRTISRASRTQQTKARRPRAPQKQVLGPARQDNPNSTGSDCFFIILSPAPNKDAESTLDSILEMELALTAALESKLALDKSTTIAATALAQKLFLEEKR